MPAFIDDGYTCDGFIAAEPGIYDAICFQYRPSTARENVLFYGGLDKATNDEYSKRTSAFVSGHITSWNIVNQSGETVPVTADNCERLLGIVRSKLLQIIQGVEPSDERPDGTRPGHVEPEAAGKN